MRKSTIIESFLANNKCAKVENKENKIIINRCWNDDSFHFEFDSNRETSFLKNLVFPNELSAIYHKDKHMYEFIFLPLSEECARSFDYIYQGKPYKLYFGKPTSSFEKLVKHFVLNNSYDNNERLLSLLQYHMYYDSDNIELKPTNFFVEGDFENLSYSEHLLFFKHINLMLTYYDRKSPYIIIYDSLENTITDDVKIPCKKDFQTFPGIINSKKIDSTLLELLEAARLSSSYRMKYIFYYQVLEYCSYYYLENELKRKLTNIIKSPDILNSDIYSAKIIELYSEYNKNHTDTQKLDKLLADLCVYDDIKNELAVNSKYFVEKICFDGGLEIDGIFNNKDEINTPPKGIMVNIRKNIDTIRNVLVHARESRENVVISPTSKNSMLLRPYLYLLRRMAEVVVLRFD